LNLNRSEIINIDFIKDVISYSNNRLKVVLKDIKHDELIVARDRVKSFKDWLG